MITENDVSRIVDEALDRAFARLGLFPDDDGVETRKDFVHLRKWRMTVEQAESVGKTALFKFFVVGLVGASILGAKAWLLNLIPPTLLK